MILEQIQGFISTPKLWDGKLLGVEQFEFPSINMHDFQPKPIPQNIRLGHQVEYIFHQLIAYSEQYEILLFNQPIKNENRTLGEIDFILKDTKENALLHIELTYKFYLIDDSKPNPIYQLIGPNKKDSFIEKINKIKNHQFKLLHKEETYNLLNNKLIDINKITSKVCFKGQLFIPFHKKKYSIEPFTKHSIYGFWITKIDFKSVYFLDFVYFIPTKKEWLVAPHNQVNWKNYDAIIIDISSLHSNFQSPMIWLKNSCNQIEKAFIVWW
jgi:uncharacterized protein